MSIPLNAAVTTSSERSTRPSSAFSKIGLMARQHTSDVADTLSYLVQYLAALKVGAIVEQETLKVIPNCSLPGVAREHLNQHCEVLIVVGGDGSLLSAARGVAQQNLPVIGVNRGTLGFLTDILPDKIHKIGAMLGGEYREEQRFLVESTVYDISDSSQRILLGKDIALNDVVLLSQTVGRMISFALHLDDVLVCNYRADGLIISTPTGSTAHALSGGGPIVHPSLNVLTIVPMFSHNLSSRPIVISADGILKITAAASNTTSLKIIGDGQNVIIVPQHGEVTIRKACEKLRLLHPLDYDYFESLRVKLGWEV